MAGYSKFSICSKAYIESKGLYCNNPLCCTMAKKSKERLMKFKVIVEKDEDGYYVADVPELQGCHTQAKDKRELMKRVREVIALCLEDANAVNLNRVNFLL